MRHVRKKLALRLIRSFHVAVQSLKFDRSAGGLKCSSLLTEESQCQKEHAQHTKRPERPPKRTCGQGVRCRHTQPSTCWQSNNLLRRGEFLRGVTARDSTGT